MSTIQVALEGKLPDSEAREIAELFEEFDHIWFSTVYAAYPRSHRLTNACPILAFRRVTGSGTEPPSDGHHNEGTDGHHPGESVGNSLSRGKRDPVFA